jgi:hypothetical protein
MHRAALLFTGWLATIPAQSPAAADDDLAALASTVEQAHRPKGPVPPVTALRSVFQVHLLDPGAEQKGVVDLAVRYLEWTRPNAKKPTALIRYELGDGATEVVRGRDRDGPWHRVQGQPRDLQNADYERDYAIFQQHSNLAKQLVRFLSPGTVLRELQQASAIGNEDLTVERGTVVACRVVEGVLPSFPLVHQGQDDVPVHTKFFVDRASGQLLALDVWPLQDGKRDDGKGERILLLHARERDGLLVPGELRHLFRDQAGRLRPNSKAVMVRLELRPALAPEDFDRTR